MGGIVEDIFGGGGDSETTVTYETPYEQKLLYNTIAEEIRALRPLVGQAVPGVQNAIQQYIQKYQNWLEQTPRFFEQASQRFDEITGQTEGKARQTLDEVRKILLQDIQEAEQKIPQIYEEAKQQTKELTQEVLQDALRNTIRKMALQGLVSQTAGTQAMSEQFRQYEYEPLQRLTEQEAGVLSSLISQGLGAQEALLKDYARNVAKTQQASMALKSGLAQQQLGFQLSLPDIYNAIMRAQQQYALTPFELRRTSLGTLTGSAGALQQLAPSNVTQSTSGGINPIFGGLVGTAGTLGLFKLFGLI